MSSPQAPIWELPDRERPVEGLDSLGLPDPDYAAALGLVSAPLGRRALAAAIDVAVYCVLQVPAVLFSFPLFTRLLSGRISWYGFVNHPDFVVALIVAGVTLLLTILFLVGQLVMQGRWGFTLGKLATGLRTVNVSTLAKPGVWRTTARAALAWLPAVTVVGTPVVLASPLWARDDRERGWHDRVGRAWVIDARRGLNPYDAKRMRVARKTITSAPAPRPKSLPSLATSPDDRSASYRPGTRTSAGVLGVARPHSGDGREVVGLTGLEPGESHPGSPEPGGIPRLGAYVEPRVFAQEAPAAGPWQSETAKDPAPARRPESDSQTRGNSPVATPSAPVATAPIASAPVASAPVASAPVASAPVGSESGAASHRSSAATLLLDSGEQLRITGPVVLGRAPVGVGGALPLAITDPGSSISKSHLVLRPVAGGLEVIDQGSTNGTVLVHDGREALLAAGTATVAAVGDTIRFGDRTARVLGS